MQDFRVGQRWSSDAEPELGLGALVAVEERQVEIEFDASASRRRYAKATAPIRRVRFQVGDEIQTRAGERLVVRAVEEEDGLLTYVGDGERVPERDVGASATADDAAERLIRGEVDGSRLFELRRAAFHHLHRLRTSRVRGLVGARIDLIPHQLFIADEVTRREAPRVLLADEVGLGKTIEACLIVHRLLLSGRAERVLVVVPEHLVHQWFVELLRRFQMHFRIFDEERCAGLEGGGEGDDDGSRGDDAGNPAGDRDEPGVAAVNPFLEEQLVLCSLGFLRGAPERAAQAVAAGWDVLVVDEAHHLVWQPGAPSAEYALVDALAARSESVLLLTGTPAQLGEEGHFARLRLLDPARHTDLERYRAESAAYAGVVQKLSELQTPADALPDDGSIVAPATEAADAEGVRESEMLDRYGPGRVMFRNTRASIGGFPRRIVLPSQINATFDPDVARLLAGEIDLRGRRTRGELTSFAPNHVGDPRVPWLAALLRSLAPEKVLVIVQTAEQAIAIGEALSREVTVKRAVFHEGLTLLQRDRNAAYFAEEDGARLLLCSEIGSEGRNFQFAHHLVLFDLPLDPELLEQRIGRLDRIGQRSDVTIHVPYVRRSAQEVLFRWYHEGLEAFARPVADGWALRDRLGARVSEIARRRGVAPAGLPSDAGAADELGDGAAVDALVAESRALRDELAARVAAGRDRLLERSSYRPLEAGALVDEIARQDGDPELEEFMQRAFDEFGVVAEDLGARTFRLGTERMVIDAFPGLAAEGETVTFSRAYALRREDVSFLTWDHPMVLGALDLLVSSARGSAAVAIGDGARTDGLLLEASFALEAAAPPRLGLDRFLPTASFRVVVDEELHARDGGDAVGARGTALRDAPSAVVEESRDAVRTLVPRMLACARTHAEERSRRSIRRSVEEARRLLSAEVDRLVALARDNPAIRPEEIDRLRERLGATEESLRGARLRLDALRVIHPAAAAAARARARSARAAS